MQLETEASASATMHVRNVRLLYLHVFKRAVSGNESDMRCSDQLPGRSAQLLRPGCGMSLRVVKVKCESFKPKDAGTRPLGMNCELRAIPDTM